MKRYREKIGKTYALIPEDAKNKIRDWRFHDEELVGICLDKIWTTINNERQEVLASIRTIWKRKSGDYRIIRCFRIGFNEDGRWVISQDRESIEADDIIRALMCSIDDKNLEKVW